MSALAAVLAALVLAGPALASERHPTLGDLESEVMCPTCKTTLDQSNAPIANRIRAFISARIAAGDTKSEIKDKLVLQFGEAVLAAPPKHGFNLLAWVLPFVGVGIGAIVLALLAWRWSRARSPGAAAAGAPLEPELERRVDEELARFEA
ncbi:MAG TPA: cytochrome c-type biogenesis protein [Gaiellaceae bacterium]|nr:cytochrome c-type biogenesis protein [Gaiellaceae bacterium]